MEHTTWTGRGELLVIAVLAAMLGCGDDDSGSDPARMPDAAAPCPQLAGTWTIASHCSAALVGMTVPVTQKACVISTGGAFPGLSGAVDALGRFTLSGTIGGTLVTCTGSAMASTLTESCTGNCNVTLSR